MLTVTSNRDVGRLGPRPTLRQVVAYGAVAGMTAEAARQLWYSLGTTKSGQKRKAKHVNYPKKGSNGQRSIKKKKMPRVSGTKTNQRTGKRRTIRAPRKAKRTKKSLKSRLIALERNGPKNSVYQCRVRGFAQAAHAVNQCLYIEEDMWYPPLYESKMDALPFLDRASATATEDISLVDRGLEQRIRFSDIYMSVKCKNAGEIPVKVSIYWYRCVGHTGTSPKGMLEAGDEEIGITNADVNMLVYPSDIKAINASWKPLGCRKAVLQAGDILKSVETRKSEVYDPEVRDSLSNPGFVKGSIVAMIRVEGVLCHGVTTPTQVGNGDGVIDVQFDRNFNIHYQSDAAFRKIEIDHGGADLDGGGSVAGATVEQIKDEL